MKLVPKLTLAFIAVTLVIHAQGAYRRVVRESKTYSEDRDRDVTLVAQSMADAATSVWHAQGDAAARAMIVHVSKHDESVRVRWVCGDATSGDAPSVASVECGALVGLRAEQAAHAVGEDRRYAYVPVVLDGHPHGAIEVSASLAPEQGFVRRTIVDTLKNNLINNSIILAVSLILGVWLVARPTRALVAKARRVAKGDFEGPLVLPARDEFGELASEMNAMSAQLGELVGQVKTESAARVHAMEQLRHADRLTTVGKLASGIAHELGTPLNVIEARSSMIASGEATGETAKHYAQIVVDASDRMTRIIRQLLAFARQRGPEKTKTDVVEIAKQSIDLLRPLARKKGVELRVVSGEGETLASADAMQIQQALTNLVVNAIQASDAGRSVEVRVGHARLPPPHALATRSEDTRAEDDYVSLCVADEGTGIARENLEHVFEPFFTTKDVGEGTGLGLSVAYGIVRDHGGWISVASELGHGSRFSMYLPRAADATKAESGANVTSANTTDAASARRAS